MLNVIGFTNLKNKTIYSAPAGIFITGSHTVKKEEM